MSLFFRLSFTLDPDPVSHMLFFLEGGNSENAKSLIYLWLRKRPLHDLKVPSFLSQYLPKTLNSPKPSSALEMLLQLQHPW